MNAVLRKLENLVNPDDCQRECRTHAVSPAITDFGDCLTEERRGCPYAVAFGSGVLCFHPDWHKFQDKS